LLLTSFTANTNIEEIVARYRLYAGTE
jgi:hypothetical protein